MNSDQFRINILGISIPYYKLNAFLSILGIYLLGIFLTWYLTGIFKIPLPENVALKALSTTILQAILLCVLPYVWAIKRLDFSLKELGISRRNLWQTTILGCALYSLAFAAFVHCSSDPVISHHGIRTFDLPNAFVLFLAMSIGAAITDIATRGFILFTLLRYTNLATAVTLQNAAWFAGHVSEVGLLSNCLGLWPAIGLTLTLGILGDVIALKTRNVIGLSIAHILLNVALAIYLRSL